MTINDIRERVTVTRETADGFQALCPAHNDEHASLSIVQARDKVLLHCHAGCSAEQVCAAMDIKTSDLFTDSKPKRQNRLPDPAKSSQKESRVVAEYNYTDADGNLLYQVVRFDPKDFRCRRMDSTPTSAGWTWSMKGVKKVLYRLPNIHRAIQNNEPIFVVEGEKDVHSLESLGLTATCSPGGAGKWLRSYAESLADADVIIIPDNDEPGRRHAQDAAKSLQNRARRVRVAELTNIPPKGDVSDWAASGGTTGELLKVAEATDDWEPEEERNSGNVVGIDGEMLNDMGNARRMAAKFGQEIRYCCDAGRWYVWDGRRWAKDEAGRLMVMAKTTIDGMMQYALSAKELAEAAADKDALNAVRAFERHAVTSGNHRRLQAMIALAASEQGIFVMASEMDSDGWLFNCANGTIDLRTGGLRQHDRADLITKISDVAYDRNAQCPHWEAFVTSIFANDPELIDFVHHAAGYTLTGNTSEQVFFILYGCGSNGKSTFITTLRSIFGNYETKTSTDTLTEKTSPATNDIAALHGARFVNAVETRAGKKLAESLVKELTGQDAVSARFLYQEFFTFTPVFKLWLACNHVPTIHGQDQGIWRRIRMIPFTRQYHDKDSGLEPVKDKTLPDKLSSEKSGILAWLVRGCLSWQGNGLPSASAVYAATGQLQQDMDIFGEFLDDRCYFDQAAYTKASDLYAAYCEWSEENGEKPISKRWFGMRLSERGNCEQARTNVARIWIGIGLRDGFKDDLSTNGMRIVT